MATTATPLASPSSPIHSLSARTHTPSLSLAHSHLTHTPHTHASHTRLTHTPHTHASHTHLTHTPHTHASHTPHTHASHTRLTHTPHTHASHTRLTHTPHTPPCSYATLTTMAAAAGDPATELEPAPLSLKSLVWKYFGFPVSYADKKDTVCKLGRN